MTTFIPTEIPDIIEITTPRFDDERGFFSETYNRLAFENAGLFVNWMQDNYSYSSSPATLRGLHFQVPPVAQHKLVRVLRGAIFDVAVDLRKGSPQFSKWVGRVLSADNRKQLLVPVGFAHGFMTLVEHTEVSYKVSAQWSREHERAILWNDATIAIKWPDLGIEPTLSEKDAKAPRLSELDSPFVFQR